MKRILLLLTSVTACLSSDQLQRRDYDARYQRAVRLCGNADAAFQDGYNAGYAGDPMRGEWAELCVPAARAVTVAGYQRGFLQGATNAPVRVVHTLPASRGVAMPVGAISARAASQCTFDSDCGGGGLHCRDHACMGNGVIGEGCAFNDDCLGDHCFGGACRE
jgi:hypothetical protein